MGLGTEICYLSNQNPHFLILIRRTAVFGIFFSAPEAGAVVSLQYPVNLTSMSLNHGRKPTQTLHRKEPTEQKVGIQNLWAVRQRYYLPHRCAIWSQIQRKLNLRHSGLCCCRNKRMRGLSVCLKIAVDIKVHIGLICSSHQRTSVHISFSLLLKANFSYIYYF